MFKHLFFDDQRLYVRENLRRVHGQPAMVGCYQNHDVHVFYGWSWAVMDAEGRTHLFYQGQRDFNVQDNISYLAAISDNGIDFQPRCTAAEAGIHGDFPHAVLPTSQGVASEIGAILADPVAPQEERYKMLFTDNSPLKSGYIEDYVLASRDLIHWRKIIGSSWNPYGTEPVLGGFHNPVTQCTTILTRPCWGQRRVAWTDTRDWHYYTPAQLCLQCDPLDEPLAELYGMPAIAHDGWFIGFPHIFARHPQARVNKFRPGTMHFELAYSLNGHNWWRFLRTPFIPLDHPDIVRHFGRPAGMVSAGAPIRQPDGGHLFYCTVNTHEHGTHDSGLSIDDMGICIFRLRPDGFAGLETDDARQESRLATRSLVWQGRQGPVVNLVASHATCALYNIDNDQPLEGFSHQDCEPFSGDNAAWIPSWRGGSPEAWIGREIVIELRFQGTLFSLAYDGVPMVGSDSFRFHHNGGQLPPIRPGF